MNRFHVKRWQDIDTYILLCTFTTAKEAIKNARAANDTFVLDAIKDKILWEAKGVDKLEKDRIDYINKL